MTKKQQSVVEAIITSLKVRNTKSLPFMYANEAPGWVVLGTVIDMGFAD